VTGKGPNGRSKRRQVLSEVVGAMIPASVFGGRLWAIGGSPGAGFAAFGVIFAVLLAIYLHV
jgi:hypothetical protein